MPSEAVLKALAESDAALKRAERNIETLDQINAARRRRLGRYAPCRRHDEPLCRCEERGREQ